MLQECTLRSKISKPGGGGSGGGGGALPGGGRAADSVGAAVDALCKTREENVLSGADCDELDAPPLCMHESANCRDPDDVKISNGFGGGCSASVLSAATVSWPSTSARARSTIHIWQCLRMNRPRYASGSSASCLRRMTVKAPVTSPCSHCTQHQGQMPGRHSLSAADGACEHSQAYCWRSCSKEPSALAGEVESGAGCVGAPPLPAAAMRQAQAGQASRHSRGPLV